MNEFSKLLTGNTPLIQVDAVLSAPEVTMRPTAPEVYNIIIHSVKDFLERFKSFIRWMDGTCLPCQPISDGDEQIMFSFFEDIVQVIVLAGFFKLWVPIKLFLGP